jgi:transcriptional regulator with XRE-family HTH domain
MNGPDLLKEALREKGWSQLDLKREIEKKLGEPVADGLVSRWCRGVRVPGLTYAVAIEDLTAVPARAWSNVPTPDDSPDGTKRVEGWRAGTKALSVDSIALFPAALADRVLARLRDAVATKADGNRAVLPVPTHVMRASSALGEFAGVAAEALADGVIDDKERGVLRKCVQRIRTVVDHVSLDVDRAAGAGR